MTNFVDKLRLAERAEEDIYFARIDRELIEALHQQEQLGRQAGPRGKQREAAAVSAEPPAANGELQGADESES